MGSLSEKSSLTCEEICRIIDKSQQNKVRILKFDGLELVFHVEPEPEPLANISGTQVSATEIAAIQEEENKKALIQGELATKQQYLDELILQDPYALEELIAKGDIEDDVDDGDDE